MNVVAPAADTGRAGAALVRAPSLDDRAAVAACRRVLQEKSKSFALASKLLPKAFRDEIAVVYAWCRYVDDAIDLVPKAERPDALAKLRAELDAIYAGLPMDDATLAAFSIVVRARAIPRRYCDELLAGMEMDVDRTRYDSMEDLLLYCHRVAGVVGLILCHVMGVRDPKALPQAAHLGIAMQLTNICRDVAEDLEDGRVYVPRALLGFDLRKPPMDELHVVRAQVAKAVTTLLREADRYYASADLGIPSLPFRCALAVHAARLVYSAIGHRLLSLGADPFLGRTVVPTSTKVFLVLRAVGRGLLELPARLIRRRPALPPDRVLDFPHDVVLPN